MRSVTSVRQLLILHFQAELETDILVTDPDIFSGSMATHTIVSGAHHDTSNTDTVPDVSHDVSNTQPAVSEIRRNTLKSREDTDSRNPTVSTLVLCLSPSNQATA